MFNITVYDGTNTDGLILESKVHASAEALKELLKRRGLKMRCPTNALAGKLWWGGSETEDIIVTRVDRFH